MPALAATIGLSKFSAEVKLRFSVRRCLASGINPEKGFVPFDFRVPIAQGIYLHCEKLEMFWCPLWGGKKLVHGP